MLDHGHNLDNLKAAFPLLAGCELDLARLSRNVCDEKGYNDHLDNAKSWLQMIYGVDSPAVKLAAQNAFSSHTTPQPSETQSSHGKESRLLKRYNPMTKAGRTLSTGGNSRRSHCLIARKSLPEAPFGRISNTGNFDWLRPRSIFYLYLAVFDHSLRPELIVKDYTVFGKYRILWTLICRM